MSADKLTLSYQEDADLFGIVDRRLYARIDRLELLARSQRLLVLLDEADRAVEAARRAVSEPAEPLR